MTNREKFINDLFSAIEVLQNTLMDVGDDLDHSDDPANVEASQLLSSVWTEVEKVEEFALQLDAECREGHLDRESSLEINDQVKDLVDLV